MNDRAPNDGSELTEDEERWLREFDESIKRSMAECEAGGGIDIDVAFDMVLEELRGEKLSR